MPMGKASLAESFGLPAVQSPSRTRFPKSTDLLKFHGFDAGFDRKIRRTADAIVAEETPLDNWFGPAVERCVARRDLARLPRARLRFAKPLAAEGAGDGAAKDGAAAAPPAPAQATDGKKAAAAAAAAAAQQAEAFTRVAELLASALIPCYVQAQDVQVSRADGRLVCEVPLRWSGASMLTATEALHHAANDKKAFHELHEALAEAGAAPEGPATVVQVWPIERAREEVRLAFPQYDLPLQVIEKKIVAIVERSWKDAQAAWHAIGEEVPSDLDVLAAPEPLARYRGELMPVGVAERRNLHEDPRLHGASKLDELMADAVEAQHALKEVLAEGSTWSTLPLNDPAKVPYANSRRTWTSATSDPAPNAQHYDPGVKDRHTAFEKAKRLQRSYEAAPPMREVMDFSRLGVTFSAPREAAEGMRRLLDRFEVVWFDNGFRSPGSSGHREAVLGVQLQVAVASDAPTGIGALPTKRRHISEIVLRLQELHAARQASEPARLAELHEVLAECGVKPMHVERCGEVILRALAYTDGVALREAVLELARLVMYYAEHASGLSAAGLQAAEQLADEMADQALALGVDAARAAKLLEAVPRLNEKRSLRDRRVALVHELARRLQTFAGVEFGGTLAALLDEFRSLPSDAIGRVCLQSRWWELPRFAAARVPLVLRSVAPGDAGGVLRAECEELMARAKAIADEERALVGDTADLAPELRAVAARSSAQQLTEALLRFLLARGAGVAAEPLDIAKSSQWAQTASGASVDTLGQVVAFMRWAAFEDQLCAAVEAVPSLTLIGVLREALQADDADGDGDAAQRARCVARWQSSGLPNICRRLARRDAKALSVSLALMDLGTAETRSQITLAMTGDDGADAGDWAKRLVAMGVIPLLAVALSAKGDGRTLYAAAHALRFLADCPDTRQDVSEAGLLPRCCALARDGRIAGEDVSYLALCVLNRLAKMSDEQASAIREQGLAVDTLGRVKRITKR